MTRSTRAMTAVLLMLCLGIAGGCQLLGIIAVGVQGVRDTVPRKVPADYQGLEGKTFAVVVAVDRMVQTSLPTLQYELTQRITERLRDHAGAAGYVPANEVVLYLTKNPGRPAMLRSELAEELGGVDRLVLIEIYEFRNREPGNSYLWNGLAAANVAVVESDSSLPEEFAYQRTVQVAFPDAMGFGPEDMSESVVNSELLRRLADRAGWLLYDHEEPADIKY